MQHTQSDSFIPFDHFVNRAKRERRSNHVRSFGARKVDFTDAVDVTVVDIDDVPEFADTVPANLPEVTYVTVDIAVTDDVLDVSDVIADKIERAKHFVAASAFAQCLQDGYFPPRCQKCGD